MADKLRLEDFPGLVIGGDGTPPAAPAGGGGLPGQVIAADPPPGTWWDSVMRAINLPGQGQMVSNIAHGVAGLPGSIYDLAALPQNLLADATGAESLRARPAQERVKQGLQAVGLPGDVGPNWWDKSAEFLSGLPGMIAGGGVLAKAPGAVTRAVGETLQAKPVQQAVAAATAGAGATVAKNQFPDSPLAEAAGALGGGLLGAGTAGLIEGVGHLLRGKLSLLGDSAEIAKQLYFGQTQDPESALNRIISYTRDNGPGAFKTTAEQTGDPGQAAVEQAMRQKTEGGGPASFVARDAARQEARIALGDQVVPPDAGNAMDVALQLRNNAQLAAAQAEADRVAAQQGVTGARDAIAPPLTPEQAGAQIQPKLAALEQGSSKAVGLAKAAVDPDGTTSIDTRPIRQIINDVADKEFGSDVSRRPQEVKDLLARLAPEDTRGRLSFDQMQDLRASLLRASQPSPGGQPTNLQFVQARAAQAINDQLEAAAAKGDGFSPEQLGRYNTFRDMARTHGARFDSDPVAGVTDTTRVPGRFRMGEVLAPGEFFQPDVAGGDSMRRFMTAITDPATGAPDPAMLQPMLGHIAGEIGKFTGPDGVPDPAALAKFLSNHAPAFRALPGEVQQRFSTLGAAGDTLARTNAATADSVQAANTGVARLFLNGSDPDRVMAQLLQGKQSAAQVQDLMNRMPPGGQDALGRSYVNAMLDKMPDGAPSTGSMMRLQKWLDDTKDVRNQLFPAAQQKNFEVLLKDLTSQTGVAKSAEGSASGDLSNLSNAQVLKALVEGAPVPRWLKDVANTTGQPTLGQMGWLKWVLNGKTRDVQAHLFDMARDPETLAMLLRKASPGDLMRLVGRGEDISTVRAVGRLGLAGGRLAAPTMLRTGVLATGGSDDENTTTVTAPRYRPSSAAP